MLFAESALNGYAIEAIDGRLGNVRDMLFDDRTWKMRWLVVDTGDWLSGRKVLIHPSAILNADHERQALVINLAKVQVEQSPELNSDQPVSHQMETRIFDHYQWDPYWGSGSFTMGAMAAPLSAPPYFGVSLADGEGWRTASLRDDGDPHLRSVAAVSRYHVRATDGEIGHVENFLIDDKDWDIHYIIVATTNWWPGRHVLLSPYCVREIVWSERQLRVDVTRDRVKASPPWDPIAMIGQVYQKQLHRHYGWPGSGV